VRGLFLRGVRFAMMAAMATGWWLLAILLPAPPADA